ncbi:GNAT family N-acetyltransferase [Streptomyces sp. WMMC940]|uniref:GNAT family N-acetyltransferase n=1 Tax=Streptomyces sp. WMMC940 TaxID=3015153 RepID=UPI0022B692A9|nr:GNAT family N-acetyltransferase [Streptomyces sp. WMMC940]MCZ7462049.1 GNAT family N-acetyltransferase [Streptomyces sp. WMMC940]
MDHDEAVLALYDRQMRRGAVADGPGARVEHVGGVVRQTAGHDGGWNGVLWSDLDGATADAAVAEQVHHFASLGREFEWKLYGHDRPADLADRLLAAGFVREPAETLMAAPVGALRDLEVELPSGVTLREVTDTAGVELAVRGYERAFGADGSWLREHLLEQLVSERRTVVAVVATAEGEPVGSSRLESAPGRDFAGLWSGGTVPEWRGRGLYRASVAFRARIAAERGHRFLQVDALPSSRPILERLGFTALGTTTPFLYRPQATERRG